MVVFCAKLLKNFLGNYVNAGMFVKMAKMVKTRKRLTENGFLL